MISLRESLQADAVKICKELLISESPNDFKCSDDSPLWQKRLAAMADQCDIDERMHCAYQAAYILFKIMRQ
jgi:hypothetical protein